MLNLKKWLFGLAAAGVLNAEPVDLKGYVIDHDKAAIAGAKVKLKRLGLEAATDDSGRYRITGSTTLNSPRAGRTPRFAKGLYRFEAGTVSGTISVSVFDLRGMEVAKKVFPAIGGAEYAFNPASLLDGRPANSLYLVSLNAGGRNHAFKVAGSGIQDPGSPPLSLIASGPSGAMAKREAVLAVVDTLEISHEAHETLFHPIESYLAELDSLELRERDKSGRLLIADGSSNLLKILDLNSGTVLDSFDIGGSGAALYPTADGRFGVAILGGIAGRVRIVNSGLFVGDDGDHIHRGAVPPKLSPIQWSGVKPVHYISHHGWSAIHFDGDTAAAVNADARMLFLKEADFTRDSIPSFGMDLAGPAHGVGLMGEDGKLLVTVPNPHYAARTPGAGSTPYGFKVYDKAFNELQDFSDTTLFARSCRGLHGEASMGRYMLFGCNSISDSGALLLAYDTVS